MQEDRLILFYLCLSKQSDGDIFKFDDLMSELLYHYHLDTKELADQCEKEDPRMCDDTLFYVRRNNISIKTKLHTNIILVSFDDYTVCKYRLVYRIPQFYRYLKVQFCRIAFLLHTYCA